MSVEYTYTKEVVAERLGNEIRASSIMIALDYIVVLGSTVDIWFKAELSQAEETTLDSILEAHIPTPLVVNDPMPVNFPTPQEIVPLTTKNEHTLQPLGCDGDQFESITDGHICAITLSNKSQDGLTFNYNSDLVLTPHVGDYVFQKDGFRRSWITSLDTQNHTMTFEMPYLDNGIGVYSKGFYLDTLIRDWFPVMYLWSLSLTVQEFEYENNEWVLESTTCPDFCELSIVDKDDLFLTDAYCLSYLGVTAANAEPILLALGFEQNGEYEHWTKYYDESWVININNMNVRSPDASPGAILAGLYLRTSFFSTELVNHRYRIYTDYYLTSKDL